MKNQDVPKLLRAIASGNQAKENKHDIILNIAADQIERYFQDREKVAALMLRTSIATGHGDTIDDLLRELEGEIIDLQKYKMAYQDKEKAMEVLFDRLHKAGVDCSDLIP